MRSLAVFAALLVVPAAVGQVRDLKPPTKQVPPALDRIAMTEFVCDPATIPPGATQVTLRVSSGSSGRSRSPRVHVKVTIEGPSGTNPYQ